MDKDNKHPFESEIVYFGTKHEKAAALAPLFSTIGMKCQTVKIDTDKFGTFAGEVERQSSAKDTLRKKVHSVIELLPDSRFIVASEGSFGPHPFLGLTNSDLEMILFFDRETGLEIFVEELSTDTNNEKIEFGPCDDFYGFLDRVKFPSHGVVVQSKDQSPKTFKGLNEFSKLGQAVIDAFLLSSEPRIVLSADMRASFNPTRMQVIEKAGQKLLDRLRSFCPSCATIGFGPTRLNRGLQCSRCGLATKVMKEVVLGCVNCGLEQSRPRHDGVKLADPAECEFCNP